MDFAKFMKMLSGQQELKVEKTIPMKPEWATKWLELHEARKLAEEADKRAEALFNQFWSEIQLDTGIYENMRYNEEKQVIEVIGCICGKCES